MLYCLEQLNGKFKQIVIDQLTRTQVNVDGDAVDE